MNVAELIAILEKVKTKTAYVYMNDSESIDHGIDRVVVEYDLRDDDVCVVLKTDD